MNFTSIVACSLVAVALSMVSGIASATDFYAGVGVGQSKSGDYEDYVRSNFDDGSITSASFEDSDTSFRFFVGATITPNFSAELGHIDLGEATTDAQSNGCCFYNAGPVKHSASADGLDLSLVGRMPVSDAAGLNVRIGMLKWNVDEKISDSANSASGSDDGSDFFYAFGGEYRFAPQFGLRAEYAFYKLDTQGGSFDVTLLSASGAFYFGQ